MGRGIRIGRGKQIKTKRYYFLYSRFPYRLLPPPHPSPPSHSFSCFPSLYLSITFYISFPFTFYYLPLPLLPLPLLPATLLSIYFKSLFLSSLSLQPCLSPSLPLSSIHRSLPTTLLSFFQPSISLSPFRSLSPNRPLFRSSKNLKSGHSKSFLRPKGKSRTKVQNGILGSGQVQYQNKFARYDVFVRIRTKCGLSLLQDCIVNGFILSQEKCTKLCIVNRLTENYSTRIGC